jgi:sugar lactone lactonase YvrE
MKPYYPLLILALISLIPVACSKKQKDCPDCPGASQPSGTPTLVYPYEGSWGATGSGSGQFNQPFGITILNSYVYVVDYGNARIQIFDSFGNYVSQIHGSNGVTLVNPSDIAIANGTIYVTDNTSTSAQVKKFDLSGNGTGSWGTYGPGGGAGQFNIPAGIVLDKNQQVYIADFMNNRLQRCNPDGTGCVTFGNGKAYGGVVVDNQLNVYASVYESAGKVEVFNSGLSYVGSFSDPPSGPLSFATGITLDSDGNFLVADQKKRIVKFNSSGRYLTEFGNNGAVTLAYPQRLAIDSNGNVYLTDNIANAVYKFSPF